MKLREQFSEVEIIFEGQTFTLCEDEFYNTVDTCIKISDNYAIEFAEYIYARPNIFNNGSSTKQVLSLFKIEKKL